MRKGFFFHIWTMKDQGPVVQSVVSLTSSLRVISLTVLADLIHNILIFFAEKMWVAFALHCKSYSHFFSKKFRHICVSLDVNFNESLTNEVVSFEQLGPGQQAHLHYVNLYQQSGSSNWLAENYKWAWPLDLFSMTRVKGSGYIW